jgi:hypothetical protein
MTEKEPITAAHEPNFPPDELDEVRREADTVAADATWLREMLMQALDDLEAAYIRIHVAYGRLDDEAKQIKEYRHIFDLQWTRMERATALWRAESPADRAAVMPDLGNLLDWLIERGDGIPEPCQPIGCDNGFHLPGCGLAEVDADSVKGMGSDD